MPANNSRSRRHRRDEARATWRPSHSLLLDEPKEDEVGIHEALLQWARWCALKWIPGRAASAEGQYVPPAANIYDPPEPRAIINPLVVVELNAALLFIPDLSRRAVRMRYFDRLPDRLIARRIDCRIQEYSGFMRDARLKLKKNMETRGFSL